MCLASVPLSAYENDLYGPTRQRPARAAKAPVLVRSKRDVGLLQG